MKKISLLFAMVLLGLGSSLSASAAPTLFTFANAGDRLAAASGPGTLEYFDPNGTDWGPADTQFGKASSFGIPAIAGVDPDVMTIPACTPEQGYLFTHNSEPNGAYGEGVMDLVSNYTMVFDIFYPAESSNAYRALWQTNVDNTDDADFFVHNSTNGLGISSRYLGTVTAGAWHRLVIAIRTGDNEGQAHRYIDGKFVGTAETTGAALGSRWALGPQLLFFADEDGETRPAYVSGIYFVDRTLTYDEVLALGGPNAAGANVPGELAPPETELMVRQVGVIGHRGGSYSVAPDNTLSALNKAFAEGAVGVEIDTRLTADGVAICFHDETLDRTTNGTGLVSDLSLAQIKELDAGSKFDPAFAGEKVPTVAEALAAAKGKGFVYLDIKTEGQAAALAEAIEEASFPVSDVWFWTRDNTDYAAEIRTEVPGAKILWVGPSASWNTDPAYFTNLKALGVVGFSIGTETPDPAFCARAKEEGMFVETYTINTAAAMRAAAIAGVDYIETDFPAFAASLQPPIATKASGNLPIDGSRVYDNQITLSWTPGELATGHRVHFGTVNPPPFLVEQTQDSFSPPQLEDGVTYYWRIDEVAPGGIVQGDVWSFSTPSAQLGTIFEWVMKGNLDAAIGGGQLAFGNGQATEDQISWEVSDGSIVPHLDGQPVEYLRVPAFFDRADCLALTLTDIPANGGGANINTYTFVFDVLLPAGWNWMPFFNTAPDNANDSDFFVDDKGALGIADLGYSAEEAITPDEWHRVVWTCELGAGVVTYFVDGVQVRQRTGGNLRDGRFSLYPGSSAPPQVALFGDDDGETSEVLVSAIAFVDSFLTDQQVAALGGPKATGIFPKTPPVELPQLVVGREGTNITLSWTGAAGRYLQRSTSLGGGTWTKLASTEGQNSHSEPLAAEGPVFFRLAQD